MKNLCIFWAVALGQGADEAERDGKRFLVIGDEPKPLPSTVGTRQEEEPRREEAKHGEVCERGSRRSSHRKLVEERLDVILGETELLPMDAS
eukprot:764202-Hanusia_phi.AAC.2